jgi:multisubunit Na+/H+ antiporter MnhF subunit
MTAAAMLSLVARAAMSVLVLAIALALVRLVRGPTGPDRVMALDLIAVLASGLMGVYAILASEARLYRHRPGHHADQLSRDGRARPPSRAPAAGARRRATWVRARHGDS